MSNRRQVKFLTTTVIGGLLFLVPLVFLVFILGKAIGFMMIIAKPMADFIPIDTIGGNTGALATPPGYLNPGAVSPGDVAYNGDRPFGGTVNVYKDYGDMLAVDYYEIEVDDGSGWQPLPPGAGLTITRRWMYWDGTDWDSEDQAFPYDAATFPGHTLYESREHFQERLGWAKRCCFCARLSSQGSLGC